MEMLEAMTKAEGMKAKTFGNRGSQKHSHDSKDAT